MIINSIDLLIAEAIHNKQKFEAGMYRLVKNEFLRFLTAKDAKPFDEVAQINIIQKMIKQREESIEAFKKANREDLIASEKAEMEFLQNLLPELPTKEDIVNYVDYWYVYGIEKKDMGKVIKELKEKFVGCDGKMIADIVKSKII